MSHFDTPHTAFVIGCGLSAENWHQHSCDISIGVNDAAKFGKDPDWLVLIDSRNGFKNEPERLKTITRTRAKAVFTNGETWKKDFPDYHQLKMQQFSKFLKKGRVYCSKSSPFVAISLAFNAGAKNIVLFGVDMVNHPLFQSGKKLFDYEMRQMERFCGMIKEQGTNVFVSSEYSALSKFLPVWNYSVWENVIHQSAERMDRHLKDMILDEVDKAHKEDIDGATIVNL